MSDMTIEQFCDKHRACSGGREWALANCESMQDAWDTIKPEWMIWIATRPGVLTDRELRLFAVWSARQVQHLMSDQRSVHALDVAERFANGEATGEELKDARTAADAAADAAWADGVARAAAWDACAAMAAARAASWAARAAAWDACAASADAWAAAMAAARAAARVSARDARDARDAYWLAAGDAAWADALVAQAEWLRKNTTPNFKEAKL